MKTTIFSTIMLSAIALTACSDDTYNADPAKDWAGTTSFFSPTDEQGYSTYYKPLVGTCGDPMPYYDQKSGEFKVLYLQNYSQNGESYHPIFCVSTKDCANYTPEGTILPAGTPAEQDAGVGTGCCVYDEANSQYYIYYTGHNPICPQTEAVMRAVSTDGKNYTKDLKWMLKGTEVGLDADNFRDPHIFKADDGKWHMLISSKPSFAEFISTDLKNWTFNRTVNMVDNRMSECPDVFKMGDWWYLIYSDQTLAGRCVKYIKDKTLDALYEAAANKWYPNDDEGRLDNRGFFAGKTASNGTDRYIWGWSPYRNGTDIWAKNVNASEGAEPEWSGALVCHKLIQHEDGTLAFGPVPGIEAKYNKPVEVKAVECSEGATYSNGSAQLNGQSFVRFNRLGYHNHISFSLKVNDPADKFGISFVRGDVDDENYRYCSVNFNNAHYEPAKRDYLFRMEFLQVKKREKVDDPIDFDFVNGALSHFIPRPTDNVYNIDIYTDNSVVVIYYNNVMCYTTRIYGIQKNGWSINSYGGKVTVSNLKVSQD